jgi:hypothetical protein
MRSSNNERLDAQVARQQDSRSRPHQAPEIGSYVVPAARSGAATPAQHAQLKAALEAADEEGEGAIVPILRAWYTRQEAPITIHRVQWNRSLAEVKTGMVCCLSCTDDLTRICCPVAVHAWQQNALHA